MLILTILYVDIDMVLLSFSSYCHVVFVLSTSFYGVSEFRSCLGLRPHLRHRLLRLHRQECSGQTLVERCQERNQLGPSHCRMLGTCRGIGPRAFGFVPTEVEGERWKWIWSEMNNAFCAGEICGIKLLYYGNSKNVKGNEVKTFGPILDWAL